MIDDFFTPLTNGGTPPTYYYFSGDVWKASTNTQPLSIESPIDGSTVGYVQSVTHEEIDSAIAAAKKAQPLWEATPLNQRVKVIHLAADWIRHYSEYLTGVLVNEIAKTVGDAKSEIERTADLIDYFADEAISIRGEMMDSDNFPGFDKGRTAIIENVAHGVVLCISPFNYPVNLAASKIVPALLMGNGVIFKPATQGAISGLHLVQTLIKAGIPKGVISCITGTGDSVGEYVNTHPGIDMIAFTGSSDVGVHIAKNVGMIPLLFECGGNNPALVLPDADLEPTAREIIKGAFSYSGQRCTAIKYVLATQATLDVLVPTIQKNMAETVVMGDPRQTTTKQVGPVISKDAARRVQMAIDDAVKQGATIVVGGKSYDAYVEPTILTGVKLDMSIVAKETFGPVLSFIAVSSVDEAIRLINHSSYGLQACVFTKDEGTGMVVAKRINTGTVQINGSPQRGPDHFPFMGIRRSGLGVQGVRYSLLAMSRLKSTVVNKPQ